MTTTILFPLHNHSFGESDPYVQAISAMSAGNGHLFNYFNTVETPESTNYDIRALQQQNAGQSPSYDWNSTPWSMAQQNTHHVLPSQPQTNPNPISPANVNPIALSAPLFTPANQPTAYSDSPSSTSPSKSHFDTSTSASPISQDMYLRRDSLYTGEDDTCSRTPIATPTTTATTTAPTTTRRRRNMEYVEPGSARAIYLEKNRRAASKCRSKQKYEQEQLVERSRLFERKNRLLKAERDLLQAEVRALKDLLGQHTHCPDQRIAQYLQMEASRLASMKEFHGHF